MRICVWNVTLCRWITVPQPLEGTLLLHLQELKCPGNTWTSQPLKMKAVRFFKRSGDTCPATQCVASQKYESWTKRPWNPQISRNCLVFIICLFVTCYSSDGVQETHYGANVIPLKWQVEPVGNLTRLRKAAISGPLLWLVRGFWGVRDGCRVGWLQT